ncbi:MAG: AAA family ATPase [Candidatus Heimdallarchaeota archaeon]|nr:MAG: AAA family ATPase [Candidatus Heimdallarchaeota archaeon]
MSNTNTNFSALFANFKSVFQSEKVFASNYIPDHLWHREEEMTSLTNYFRSIITEPTASSRKVVLYGPVGTGKTVVSRTFGADLSNYLKSEWKPREPSFRFFHVNCRKTKSPHLILTTVLRQLVPGFPLRGFSVDELLRMFSLLLYEQNLVALLVLDEIDYLLPDERTNFLYSLSRIEEGDPRIRQDHFPNNQAGLESRFNLLCCTRDKNFRYHLDSSTASSLGRNFITFPPYTRNQLFDIVSSRAEQGIRAECYDDALIEVIAGLAEESGDARFAIELLWRAGKFTDQERKNFITPEHVRKAVVSVLPIERSVVEDLSIHQKLLLLSIAKLLANNKQYVTTPEVKKSYVGICEEAGVRPRRQTQIWAYLKDLGRLGLIQQEVENRHKNGQSLGRVTKIRICDVPVEEIIQSLNQLIER